MPARGGTLPRNLRVVWSRLGSGTVADGTRGTTAGLGSIARLAEVLESLDLAHGMFCKLHRCFEEIFVLPLGEAGEWIKYRLCVKFEASFLIVQAYLMLQCSRQNFWFSPPMFCAFLSLLPSQWQSAHQCWYSWYWCGSRGASITCFLGNCSTVPLAMWASACHASSRIMFTVHSSCFLGCLVGGQWLPCQIFCFFSNYLYVVVLFHFVTAELTIEGIRQFCVAVEIEERKLDTSSYLHETRRVGSLGNPPVCWSRFGLRGLSRSSRNS